MGLLGDIQSVVGTVGTVVTAAALVVGGLWAYFKFVKGRTYRPRLEVGMSGQWRQLDGMDLLHARITVQNIGNSVVTLLQRGTGLRVSVPAADQGTAPVAVAWTVLRVFEILGEHEWIEPGETVSDDVLLNLGMPEPLPVRCRVTAGLAVVRARQRRHRSLLAPGSSGRLHTGGKCGSPDGRRTLNNGGPA
jgi:hypothetical protein